MTESPALRIHTAVLLTLPPEQGEHRVVMQRRSNIPQIIYPGQLGFFGGRVEESELTPDASEEQRLADIAASAWRELGEELPGLAVTSDLMPSGSIHFNDEDSGYHALSFLIYFFRIGVNRLPERVEEGDGAEAYTVAQLRQRKDLAKFAVSKFDEIFGGL